MRNEKSVFQNWHVKKYNLIVANSCNYFCIKIIKKYVFSDCICVELIMYTE
jgi:hypothetical protein